jgi:hypothetical protein
MRYDTMYPSPIKLPHIKSNICKVKRSRGTKQEKGKGMRKKRERVSREREDEESQGREDFNRKVLFPRELQARS